jgi:hypothetical protein
MIGSPDVAAGFLSRVIRVIGTSIAIVLMFAPLKRLMPYGLTLSASSPAPSAKAGSGAGSVNTAESVEGPPLAREHADTGCRVGMDPCAASAAWPASSPVPFEDRVGVAP